MTEYVTTIEAWFQADNDEDATAIADRLGDRVKKHPCVDRLEISRPENNE